MSLCSLYFAVTFSSFYRCPSKYHVSLKLKIKADLVSYCNNCLLQNQSGLALHVLLLARHLHSEAVMLAGL